MRDADVLLHATGEQSQLTRRPIGQSVSAARRPAAASLGRVGAVVGRQVADASRTTHVDHTRGTVRAVHART